MRRTSSSSCPSARHAPATTAVLPTSTLHRFAARTCAKASVIALAFVGSIHAADTPSSDTVILSPFEVNASNDVGFVAANSLAGGRMAAPLEDTAAAYSVLTREFIDAVHITSFTEAARWSVNSTEVLDNGS